MTDTERDHGFPREDVEASLADSKLQQRAAKDRSAETEILLADLRAKAIEDGAPPSSEWIFFESPAWTWKMLCGRAGWLLYDRDTGTQHGFLMTSMN